MLVWNNASYHISSKTKESHSKIEIGSIEWLIKSLDLNLKENNWR